MTDYLQQLHLSVIFKGLDTVPTKAECANFVHELRRRLKLDHNTTIEELLTLGLNAKQAQKSTPQGPLPPPTTTTTIPSVPDVLRNRAPYKSLIKHILDSDWDFCDHRPRRVPMNKTPEEVREYLEERYQNKGPDDELLQDLSLTERQYNLMKMVLESYAYWASKDPSELATTPGPTPARQRPKPLNIQLRNDLLSHLDSRKLAKLATLAKEPQ